MEPCFGRVGCEVYSAEAVVLEDVDGGPGITHGWFCDVGRGFLVDFDVPIIRFRWLAVRRSFVGSTFDLFTGHFDLLATLLCSCVLVEVNTTQPVQDPLYERKKK